MIAFEGFDIMRYRLELDSQNTQTRMQFNETQEFYDREWKKEPRKIVPLIWNDKTQEERDKFSDY